MVSSASIQAASEHYAQQRKQWHKKLTDWGRQLIRQLRRWLPDRYLVVVADSSYAVVTLLSCAVGLNQPVTMVTRLRLDATSMRDLPSAKQAPLDTRDAKELVNRRSPSA